MTWRVHEERQHPSPHPTPPHPSSGVMVFADDEVSGREVREVRDVREVREVREVRGRVRRGGKGERSEGEGFSHGLIFFLFMIHRIE